MQKRLKKRSRKTGISSLMAVAKDLRRSPEVDQIVERALDELFTLPGISAAAIYVMDEDAQTLCLKAFRGLASQVVSELERIQACAMPPERRYSRGVQPKINKLEAFHRFSGTILTHPSLKYCASVPLRSLNRVVGEMHIFSSEPVVLHQHTGEFLGVMGVQMGIALETATLLETAKLQLSFFDYILRSSPNGIVILDPCDRILAMNRAAELILEVSLESVGHVCSHILGPTEQLARAFQEKDADHEVVLRSTGGDHKYVRLRNSSIRDEKGQYQGAIVVLLDVTEKRRTDEHIQRVSKLVSLGQLAAGIAHEVRNPLCGITYVLDELHDYFRRDKEHRERIEAIIREVDRLDGMVSSLLDFAQLNELKSVSSNVNEIIDDALLWIKKRCKDASTTVIRAFGEDIPAISVDPERLKQALLNVMINSLEAMEPGGTLRIVTSGHSERGGDGSPESKFVEISIEDSGDGIPLQDQSKVFNPFYTTKQTGTGLGLSIAHRIVTDHGGKISLESEEGRGTRFTIYLPTARPDRGGILNVGIESGIDVLDPHRHGGWMTYRVIRNVFEGLVDRDLTQADAVCCPIIPCLAKSWEITPDGLTYTFHLREDVMFHDGTPFNAEAVKFNLERMTNPHAPQYDPRAAHYSVFMWRYLDRIEVLDHFRVRIHHKEPFFDFLALLTEGGLGSAKMLSPASWRRCGNEAVDSDPVGTGPFRFVERGKKGEVVLERNRDYWGSKPYLDKLVFKPIPDPATRVAALQVGDVDFIFVPPPDTTGVLKRAGFEVVQGPVPHIWFMYLNMRSPLLQDVRVRRALNMAIDRERMARDLFRGSARVARGLQTPGSPAYSEDFVDYEYDPEAAKRLLRQAGYSKGFKMTFQTSTAGSGQMMPIQMAEWIKQDLARIGIDCQLDLYEWIEYIGQWARGIPDGVEANQISWGMTCDYWLEIVAHSKNCSPNGRNSGYYANPKVDRYLDRARIESDEQKRIALYRKTNAEITKDAAFVPIVNDLAPVVMHRKVKGFTHAPCEWYDFTRVWVDEYSMSGPGTEGARSPGAGIFP